MTIFESIVDIACWYGLDESEEEHILDAGTSAKALVDIANYLIKSSFSEDSFRLEDKNTGEIIGTWKSLIEFVLSEPSTDLLERTVHTKFNSFDNYDHFDGNTWLISH